MTTEKRQILLELLKDAWVYVHLDPRRDGVALPDFLRQEPRVVLQYGYNMPVPIADLTIDEEGIKATLSFRRTPWSTVIPWHAVFALSDGEERHFVWEADVPADLDRPGAMAPGQPTGQPGGHPGGQPTGQPGAAASGPSELTGRSTSQSTGQSTAPGPSVSSPQAKPGIGTGPAAKPGKKPRPSHLKLVD